jgi:hypothetical protein
MSNTTTNKWQAAVFARRKDFEREFTYGCECIWVEFSENLIMLAYLYKNVTVYKSEPLSDFLRWLKTPPKSKD